MPRSSSAKRTKPTHQWARSQDVKKRNKQVNTTEQDLF